jgi:hypothetical protein
MARRRTPRAVREQRIAEQVAAEREEMLNSKPMRLRSGGDSYSPGPKSQVEEEAHKILAAERRGVTSMADKTDYLSCEQYGLRKSKEIFNHIGVPDASLMRGMYRRAYNPEFGNRPGGQAKSDE